MPYQTFEIVIQQDFDLLAVLDEKWSTGKGIAQGEEYLSRLIPNADVSGSYDAYFEFPNDSQVCVRRDTNVRYSIDTYAGDVRNCTSAAFKALQRLRDTGLEYVISNCHLEFEPLSIKDLIVKAIIKGRGFVLIFPPTIVAVIEALTIVEFRKVNPVYIYRNWISAAISVIIFIALYVFYEISWRE